MIKVNGGNRYARRFSQGRTSTIRAAGSGRQLQYTGSCAFVYDANRSIVNGPNQDSIWRKVAGSFEHPIAEVPHMS